MAYTAGCLLHACSLHVTCTRNRNEQGLISLVGVADEAAATVKHSDMFEENCCVISEGTAVEEIVTWDAALGRSMLPNTAIKSQQHSLSWPIP